MPSRDIIDIDCRAELSDARPCLVRAAGRGVGPEARQATAEITAVPIGFGNLSW